MNVFSFSSPAKKTSWYNANNATHYVKLGKKRRESSKRNYYIISPRVIIKAIIIICHRVLPTCRFPVPIPVAVAYCLRNELWCEPNSLESPLKRKISNRWVVWQNKFQQWYLLSLNISFGYCKRTTSLPKHVKFCKISVISTDKRRQIKRRFCEFVGNPN